MLCVAISAGMLVSFTRLTAALILAPLLSVVPGVSAVPHEANLRYFDVSVEGPPETPFSGTYWRARHCRHCSSFNCDSPAASIQSVPLAYGGSG